MDEQKFTPGPWHESDEFNNPEHADKRCAIRGGEDEWVIAEVCGDVPESLGNTRLIAIAPELFAQLDSMQSKMNCVCKFNPWIGEEVPCETCRIRALLAKVFVPRPTTEKAGA